MSLADTRPLSSATSSLRPSTIDSTLSVPLISIGDVQNRNTIRRLAPRGASSANPRSTLMLLRTVFAGGVEILVGDVCEIRGVDDHVDVGESLEMAELAKLQRGERRLQRAAPADDQHLFDAPVVQDLQRVVGDVGGGQHIGVGDEDARHVKRDVAVADHDGPPGRQVGRHLLEVRVRVVPADEVDGGDAAGQLLAGNVQRTVGLGADRVDHRVVAFGQLAGLDMLADDDVPEEPESRVAALSSRTVR